MIVILTAIAWIFCSGVCYGILMHYDAENCSDEPVMTMFMCLIAWWFFTIIGIGYLIIKQLSKVGEFFAGFIDRILDGEKKQ